MNVVLAAIVLVVFLILPGIAAAQGNADAGRKLWTGDTVQCGNCHGAAGEGGFGPDLAGRRLTVEQFRHATRSPWGIMPAYVDKQVTDQDIADLVAYFESLPAVAAPAPWRVQVPAGAPPGQELAIATFGCAQCHGAVFADTRQDAGAAGADYAWFANLVYNHTTASPEERRLSGDNPDNPIRMGNYSRLRLPDILLQQIWQFVSRDLGLRVPMEARLARGVAAAGGGITYTLRVENAGIAGKGLTAEDVTVALTIPAGATVLTSTGAGYQGVRRDAQAGTDVAVWTIPRLEPQASQTYTITLSAPAEGAQRLRGVMRWSRPAMGDGSGDTENINPPPAS